MSIITFLEDINTNIFDSEGTVYKYSKPHLTLKANEEFEFLGMVKKANELFELFLYMDMKVTFDLEDFKIYINIK